MASSVSGMTSIDVNTIVTQLMSVERQPLQSIQKTIAGIDTRLSAFGKLQGQLSAFQDAAKALTRNTAWSATTATSSDENVARVTSGSTAVAGNYSLVVNHLAQRQTVAGASLSGPDAVVGTGALTIQLGTLSGGSFAADGARAAVDVQLDAGATLADVRDAINAKDAGVTASLVNDGTGTRLMLRSDDTGLSNAFRISASGDAGVTALAFDPQAPTATAARMTVNPLDAEVVVDGLTVTSASNKLEDVIQGVTIDLRKAAPATTIDVAVATDTGSLKTAVEKFVSAWNALNNTIGAQTRYDASSKTAGTLQGNGTVTSVQRQLRAILQSTVGGSALGRLSDAGLEIQRDGSLVANATKLDAALASPDKLRSLFAATGTDTATQGLAKRFDTMLTRMLGVDGAISTATETLQGQKTRAGERQDAFETRMTLVEARLRRQYTALDSQLAQYGSTGSFLTSKFG